jgi:hypothetical protein
VPVLAAAPHALGSEQAAKRRRRNCCRRRSRGLGGAIVRRAAECGVKKSDGSGGTDGTNEGGRRGELYNKEELDGFYAFHPVSFFCGRVGRDISG